MVSSDSGRPNQVKYHARNGTMINRAATIASGKGERRREGGLMDDSSAPGSPDETRPAEPFPERLDGGIGMIEHEVYKYARDRNIKPQGERPTRNPAVPDEISTRGAIESNEYQRNYNDG